jgi:hypothetical protein
MDTQTCNAVAVTLLAAFAMTALAQPQQPKPEVKPLPADCIAEATRVLSELHAFHDGKHKGAIPIVSGDELSRVQSLGQARGHLFGGSTLTPASSYVLVVVPTASADGPESACPLSRTDVRFMQGGFNPQPPIHYGPVRRGAV